MMWVRSISLSTVSRAVDDEYPNVDLRHAAAPWECIEGSSDHPRSQPTTQVAQLAHFAAVWRSTVERAIGIERQYL